MPDAPPSPISHFWHDLRGQLRPPHRHVAHFERVLGTTLEVQIVAGTGAQALQAQRALLAEIGRLEPVFSRFLPQSELNRWLAGSGAVPVSPELGEVLRQALTWQERSGGAFHPATEALSPLWKEAEGSGVLPDVQAVLSEMQKPLYTVRQDAGRWTATRLTRLPLGFNAFAKGYIADLACAAAYAQPGVQQVLVNIGGDLRTLGPQPVQVDIADPFTLADNAAPISSVRVQGQGVATSGRARRGFTVGGRWYSHVLDPRSGQPAGQVVSASVIAPDSASADVLATIFSVLGPHDSLQRSINLPGVACLLVTEGGQIHTNDRWIQHQLTPTPSRLSTRGRP
ncbi:FAD:protein FMN transferase [Deinococcus sp.]|uniref:FAD:protein FMN transferase n=1 Tax=Deinococcus sp. TaxID=47478 RepID=UPI003C7D45BD